MKTKKSSPTFEYELPYWQQGITNIAGIDEVGMGALAGPVCAAAVLFDGALLLADDTAFSSIVIRDSKTLSEKQRQKADAWIREHAVAFAIGQASVEEIDTINILQAARLAMKRAVAGLSQQPEILFVDGNPVTLHDSIPATNIVKGDALSYSIAAASIVAKVHRDALMKQLHEEFPLYGFAGHKGYGSGAHLKALQEYGATPHHRRSYSPVAAVLAR